MPLDKSVLYTAKTYTTGGREGLSHSSDKLLDIKLSPPGPKAYGTNPEQLFAAGWSACFLSSLQFCAKELGVRFPADASVAAEVDLCKVAESGFFLKVRLNVSLPGLDRATAESLIEKGHHTCPYSKATHANIEVATVLV